MKCYTADALESYMQRLNDQGRECTLFVLDVRGNPFLAFGEEYSHGGEAMACWVIDGDAAGDQLRDYDTCADCGSPVDRDGGGTLGRVPLSALSYPVIALDPLDVFAQESR